MSIEILIPILYLMIGLFISLHKLEKTDQEYIELIDFTVKTLLWPFFFNSPIDE